MDELPKIAQERLRRMTPRNGGAPFGDHPDPDQLTAYLEHKLPARERQAVMEHLTTCRDCRAAVALVLPDTASIRAAAERGQGQRSFWAWPGLRLAAPIAAIVVIGAAVIISSPKYLSRTTPQATKVETRASVPPAEEQANAPQPSAGNGVKGGNASDRLAAKQVHRNEVAAAKPAATVNHPVTAMALPRVAAGPSATAGAQNVQNAQTDVAQTLRQQQVPASAEAVVVEPKAQAKDERAQPEQAQGVTGGVFKAAPPAKAKEADQARDAAAAPAAPPPPASEINTETAYTEKSAVAGRKRAATALMRTVEVNTQWTISPLGHLQRSIDGGNTWMDVPVAIGVSLRAFARVDGELWVGGDDGALFHSMDSGDTWQRVKVESKGERLTQKITQIEFTDADHGIVTTAFHQRWFTADGGKSWSKR